LLKVNEVSAGYGRLQILDGVSLEAEPNRITVIVGPNGSGKSTLLKTIAGLTSIYQGQITIDGRPLSGLPPHDLPWPKTSKWLVTLLGVKISIQG